MELSRETVRQFRTEAYHYYETQGRHLLPWRQPEAGGSFDPYKILVSEVMLQQTQVPRVIPKYQEFLDSFPTVEALAQAQLGQVLRKWNGLGYNRRAKYLHEAAKAIARLGSFPNNITELVKLPGIGKNTAGAVVAYSFNLPAVFIETNIRTVYIYHFFGGKTAVSDGAIAELIGQTLDKRNPREFYWSLMDYGSYLKGKVGNLSKLSNSYARQSRFHGSKRQVRGQVMQSLAQNSATLAKLKVSITDERLENVLKDLTAEGLIRQTGETYHL